MSPEGNTHLHVQMHGFFKVFKISSYKIIIIMITILYVVGGALDAYTCANVEEFWLFQEDKNGP